MEKWHCNNYIEKENGELGDKLLKDISITILILVLKGRQYICTELTFDAMGGRW